MWEIDFRFAPGLPPGWFLERLVLHCRTTSASTALRTPRRTCCPCAYVLITMLRVSCSCEIFPDGFDLHLLHRLSIFSDHCLSLFLTYHLSVLSTYHLNPRKVCHARPFECYPRVVLGAVRSLLEPFCRYFCQKLTKSSQIDF